MTVRPPQIVYKNNSENSGATVQPHWAPKKEHQAPTNSPNQFYINFLGYCSELYNHESNSDNAALDCNQPPEKDLQPILHKKLRFQKQH